MKLKSVAGIDNWRDATAVLISRLAVPGARKFVGASRRNAVPVFLIEDSRLLQDSLASMLVSQGLELIATARSRTEAVREVKRLEPEVVLLGSSLASADGVALLQAIKKLTAAIKKLTAASKVVVMHEQHDPDDVVAFVSAGASGFITQDAPVAEVVATIRAVAAGTSVLPPLMTQTLFSHVAAQAKAKARRKRRPPASAR